MSSPLLAPAGVLASRLVRWRYHFTDFRLGVYLTSLPLSDVSLSDVINGAADGTAVVNLSSSAVRDRDPFSSTVPRRSCMWAERQEVDPRSGAVLLSQVPWAGIVMGRERSHATRQMKLNLVTWPAYFQRRLVFGTGILTQRDKFFIMRRLAYLGAEQPYVDTADPGFYGNSPHLVDLEVSYDRFDTAPWITETVLNPPLPLSGVKADRTYLDTDLKPVLEAMTELGNSGDGFDWRFTPYMATPGDLNSFRVRMDLGYPRLGRVEPPDLRWSTDKADSRSRWGYVADLSIKEDGSAVANRVTAVGAGTGNDQIRATADSIEIASRNEMAAGYPLYEASLASSTQEDRTYDTVYGKARGALLAGFASEVQVSGIKVRGDLAPTLSSYELGDDATVKVGETTTGLSETYVGQIVGRTIQPPQPGRTEQVALDVQGTVAA